jgi:hypothetical protein
VDIPNPIWSQSKSKSKKAMSHEEQATEVVAMALVMGR